MAINLTAAGCARPCRFEQKGFKLVGMKMVQAKEDLLKEHYKDLVSKPFFPSLLSYMTSGPVVPMIWEGDGVVKAGRVILGATKPSESAPGTVRGDYAIDVGRNVCHGSDAVETAVREIGLWFRESRLSILILCVYSFVVSFGGGRFNSHALGWFACAHCAFRLPGLVRRLRCFVPKQRHAECRADLGQGQGQTLQSVHTTNHQSPIQPYPFLC